MSQEHTRQGCFQGCYPAASLLLVIVASCAASSVVMRAFNNCDVGINATANAFGIVVLLPVLVVVHGVALVITYMAIRRWIVSFSPVMQVAVKVLMSVVVVAVISWAYLAIAGLPLQTARCPTGEPPWWPYWLPPSHDDGYP